jgi:hypothetical protein
LKPRPQEILEKLSLVLPLARHPELARASNGGQDPRRGTDAAEIRCKFALKLPQLSPKDTPGGRIVDDVRPQFVRRGDGSLANVATGLPVDQPR